FTNIGWSFTVNSTVTADGLGLFDTTPNGLSADYQVGLWNGSGTLLAQTTINNASTAIASASSVGRWLFNDISPVVLTAGTYVVGGFYATGVDTVIANATITNVPQIAFLASRASSEGSFAEA